MGEEVKDGSTGADKAGIWRHLEGWQPGLLAVVIAVLAALLAVPRATEPDILPLPRVDWRESDRAASSEIELAARAVREELPFEVRAVGEAFRRFGEANASQNTGLAADRLAEVRALARGARKKHGDDPLASLQALQTAMFLELLTRWEQDENVEAEIAELGGNFIAKATSSGWIEPPRKLVFEPQERRVAFRVRWADVVGLRGSPSIAPTANDWRIYYRFLIRHPEKERGTSAAEEQLRYVSVVEKVDLSYPGLFARGVLHFRLGQWAKSEAAFRGYLAEDATGPWRLRAKNHLVAAAERAKLGAPDAFPE